MGRKEIDLKNIPESKAILDNVESRYRKGLMNVLHIIGLPGTGKSWACIRLGEIISERLHGENRMTANRIVDNLLDLLKVIRAVKGPGEIVIIEEAGVLFGSRRAMSSENVDAGKIFDTLRKKRMIVLMNNPISKDLDNRLVRLSSMAIQTLSLNKSKGICTIKALKLQTNPDTGKTYRHRLKDRGGHDIHRCWLGKPNEETTTEYEAMKDKFLDELYEVLVVRQQKKRDKVLKELEVRVSGVAGMEGITPEERRTFNLADKGIPNKDIANIEGVCVRTIQRRLKLYSEKIKKIENATLLTKSPQPLQQINQ